MAEKLSPAAQAVRRAAASAYWAEEYEVASPDVIAAAALRAAVQATADPLDNEPACVFDKDYWDEGYSAGVANIRQCFESIATELENHQ